LTFKTVDGPGIHSGTSAMKALRIVGFCLALGVVMMAHQWLRNRIRHSGLGGGGWKPIRRDRDD
jgi:hypothetical protein